MLTGDTLMNWQGFVTDMTCPDRGTWTLHVGSDGRHAKAQDSPWTDLQSNQIFTEQEDTAVVLNLLMLVAHN